MDFRKRRMSASDLAEKLIHDIAFRKTKAGVVSYYHEIEERPKFAAYGPIDDIIKLTFDALQPAIKLLTCKEKQMIMRDVAYYIDLHREKRYG